MIDLKQQLLVPIPITRCQMMRRRVVIPLLDPNLAGKDEAIIVSSTIEYQKK